MRRGTPSADLFGELLTTLRLVGSGSSMRRIGERLGAPAATVSQIEKGQRALKEPRIAAWAYALEVDEDDLRELWQLSQGQVRHDGRLTFYRDHPDALGSESLDDLVIQWLQTRADPDLEALYRLAGRIAAVLRRMLPPGARPRVVLDDSDPPFPEEEGAGEASESEVIANEQWRAMVDLPLILCFRVDVSERHRRSEFVEGELVRVPLVKKLVPVVRRRVRSVDAAALEGLIGGLSGPERERVRGYIDAIIEQRSDLVD